MSLPPATNDAPPRHERLSARLKREQWEAERALGPEGRMRLALILGRRAARLAALVGR